MNEKDLVSSLVKTLREGLQHFYVVKHSERIIGGTIGVPDISITGNKDTTWLEVKFADPTFTSSGRQELTMLMLANYGHCARYIIYEKRGKDRWTFIVHPKNFASWKTQFENVFEGFNHLQILDYIRKVHNIEPT